MTNAASFSHPPSPIDTTSALFNVTRSNFPPPTFPGAPLSKKGSLLSLDPRNENVRSQYVYNKRILADLRALDRWEKERLQSVRKTVLGQIFGIPRGPPCPARSELLSLARYHFRSRSAIEVEICDFGDGRAEESHVTLGSVQQAWRSKPEWATVRWVHIPLGPGIVHAAVEKMFLSSSPKFADQRFPEPERWRSLEFQVLNIRDSECLQDQRDAFYLLSQFNRLTRELNVSDSIDDEDLELKALVAWIAQSREIFPGFWQLVQSDIPWQLTEGVRSGAPDAQIQEQFLSRHPSYKNAALVLDPFHCFHRRDGFLLTLSAARGLNYIEPSISKSLRDSATNGTQDQNTSVLKEIKHRFLDQIPGTNSWPVKTVDWLSIYIMTEFETTPNTSRAHGSLADIHSAYLPVIRDLKRRRTSQFRRHESVKLVREYVSCIDEISQIVSVSDRKLENLEILRRDAIAFGSNGAPPDFEKAIVERIGWAMKTIEKDYSHLQRTQKDLKLALDVLFQLRTMEQNELAILAESNNKAILIFTAVTIVFLPLSFFTSYFGMNLKGVVDTTKTEQYFWSVCGSIAVLVISLTFLYSFKDRIHWYIWGRIVLDRERRYGLASYDR